MGVFGQKEGGIRALAAYECQRHHIILNFLMKCLRLSLVFRILPLIFFFFHLVTSLNYCPTAKENPDRLTCGSLAFGLTHSRSYSFRTVLLKSYLL